MQKSLIFIKKKLKKLYSRNSAKYSDLASKISKSCGIVGKLELQSILRAFPDDSIRRRVI
ncbi:MAG: hypothetical protein DRR11_03265 [Gammaproteobacteria bacterium]|nr:MAG: hypothetical protein DRR11_03265 [Gammaproteobacteria bacterium]